MKPTHKYTKQITLRMDQIEASGESSGVHEEIKFFVRDTIPGEEIVASVLAVSRQRPEGFAELSSITTPSAARVPVACEHAGICGGCDWQHINAEAQLAYKKELVERALSQHQSLSGVLIGDCQASPEAYQYRYVAKWVSKMHHGKVWLGAFARRSHEVISTMGCKVHRESLESAGDALRELLNQPLGASIAPHLRYVVARESFASGEVAVVLVCWRRPTHLEALSEALLQKKVCHSLLLHLNQREGDSLFDHQSPNEVLFGGDGIPEEIEGCRVTIPMQAFLQINPSQARRMVALSLTAAPSAGVVAERSDAESAPTIIELYAGVSALSIRLARGLPGWRVAAIERSTQSVEVARQVKEGLSLQNLSLYQGDSVEVFRRHPTAEVIFLNPPRAGASPDVIAAILRAAPQEIVYTSCSPKTFSRDAAALVEGGFVLERVAPFDMFPQTAHVELVGVFVRRAG